MKNKALRFFESSGTNYSTTRRNNPEGQISPQLRGGNIKALLLLIIYLFMIMSFMHYVLSVHDSFSVNE
jgi:hypothetical protein